MDVTGTILNILKIDTHGIYYVTGTEDKIHYTDEEKNTINCCNIEGKIIWSFENKSLRSPRGITQDYNKNVYVVGSHSHNLTLIQNDGKTSKHILNTTVNISYPYSVHYNQKKKLLLFGCEVGCMAMFQVK